MTVKQLSKRADAWNCWLEIARQLEKCEVYINSNGHLAMKYGCGGNFVDIINRYL